MSTSNHPCKSRVMPASAWLVERHDFAQPAYMSWAAWGWSWVNCPNDAIKFYNEATALKAINEAPHEWELKICEHSWPDGAPRRAYVAQTSILDKVVWLQLHQGQWKWTEYLEFAFKFADAWSCDQIVIKFATACTVGS